MRRRFLPFLAASVLGSAAAFADPIDDFMHQQMKFRGIPGAALAIVKNGEIVRLGTYGFANLEHDAPVRADSVFELASLTKPFTASAIMLLVQDGKVSLEDNLAKYIPDAPDSWRGITVQQLLTHTSGMPHSFPFEEDPSNPTELTTAQMLDSLRAARLIGPGRRGEYSDPGYFLLGLIIERASGTSYADFLQKRVFDPTGMKASSVLDQWRIIPHRVAPYTLRGKKLLRGRRDWQQELPSHYGVWSSVEDVARWVAAIQRGELLPQATLDRMWTPAKLLNGNTASVWELAYGYGWMLGDYRGWRVAEHGGFSGTHVVLFRDQVLAVVVLTNLDVRSGSEPHALARGIAGLVDPQLAAPHTLAPQSVVDAGLASRLEEVLRSVAGDSDAENATERYNTYLRTLPPPAREDLTRRVDGMKSLTLFALESVADRGIRRFDTDISSLAYADLVTDEGKWEYTFWLAADGKVADARSIRCP